MLSGYWYTSEGNQIFHSANILMEIIWHYKYDEWRGATVFSIGIVEKTEICFWNEPIYNQAVY